MQVRRMILFLMLVLVAVSYPSIAAVLRCNMDVEDDGHNHQA